MGMSVVGLGVLGLGSLFMLYTNMYGINSTNIKGVLTIAAAPDFTKRLWDKELNNKQKNEKIRMAAINQVN